MSNKMANKISWLEQRTLHTIKWNSYDIFTTEVIFQCIGRSAIAQAHLTKRKFYNDFVWTHLLVNSHCHLPFIYFFKCMPFNETRYQPLPTFLKHLKVIPRKRKSIFTRDIIHSRQNIVINGPGDYQGPRKIWGKSSSHTAFRFDTLGP